MRRTRGVRITIPILLLNKKNLFTWVSYTIGEIYFPYLLYPYFGLRLMHDIMRTIYSYLYIRYHLPWMIDSPSFSFIYVILLKWSRKQMDTSSLKQQLGPFHMPLLKHSRKNEYGSYGYAVSPSLGEAARSIPIASLRSAYRTTTARAFPSPIRKDSILDQSDFPEEARSSKRKKEETK